MLTTDKKISTAEYWQRIYEGKNDNASVDASNTKRPANAFDRFAWVAKYAEGPKVLGVASGHAHIEERIQAAHPDDWYVCASDQTEAARNISKFRPYAISSVYNLDCENKHFNTIIIAQAMEYLEDEHRFLMEAKRVAHKIIITLPIGEMKAWSQLRIYSEAIVRELLRHYGEIEVWEREGDLLLVKLKFYD